MKIKVSILACSLAIWLAACSGDASQNSQSDTTTETHHADTPASHALTQNGMAAIMHNMMSQMQAMKMTNDPEVDFASMMITHHQGAIDMSNLELQQGTDANMKSMAQKIIADQTREIQELKDFLAANKLDNNIPAFSMDAMENMKKMEMSTGNTGNVDNDFAALMKAHHESALNDAQTYLKHGNNEALKTMANGMIEKQKQEIKELEGWLAAK